jgi:hypothetical protein
MPRRQRAHRAPGDVVAAQPHRAGVGRHRAREHAEQRGLARAVGPDDADRVAGADPELDAIEHDQFTVALDDALGLDERRRSGGDHRAAILAQP